MFRSFLRTAVVAVVTCTGFTFAEELKSGLQIGDAPEAFKVMDVTGGSAGQTVCYRCQLGDKPVVNVFVREINQNSTDLIKRLDKEMSERKELKGFVVLLTEDKAAAEKSLKELAEKESIKNVPLTYFEGTAGPEAYKLSKDADVTVHMWVKGKVTANHAFRAQELTSEKIDEMAKGLEKCMASAEATMKEAAEKTEAKSGEGNN